MDRRYTLLKIRAADSGDERIIEGWATTPGIDRAGDVVVPEGARFELPLPLLFQHRHDEPIGSVLKSEVTRAGIRIRAKLTAGVVRADEVWNLVRDGALSAVSVGFQALKTSPLPNGGLRFDEWEWLELSVVSVPANAGAKISVAKCAVYSDRPAPSQRQPVKIEQRTVPTPPVGKEVQAAILRACARFIVKQTAPLKERIDNIEKSTCGNGMKYLGKWVRDVDYRSGDCVILGKSMWIATRETATPPGASADWTKVGTSQ